MNIIKALKANEKIYKKFIENPERVIKSLENKL